MKMDHVAILLGQCYLGKLRGGEVRLCTQWSNGNISAGKGQLFGLDPHWTILQFTFAYKSSSHPTPRVIVSFFLNAQLQIAS